MHSVLMELCTSLVHLPHFMQWLMSVFVTTIGLHGSRQALGSVVNMQAESNF